MNESTLKRLKPKTIHGDPHSDKHNLNPWLFWSLLWTPLRWGQDTQYLGTQSSLGYDLNWSKDSRSKKILNRYFAHDSDPNCTCIFGLVSDLVFQVRQTPLSPLHVETCKKERGAKPKRFKLICIFSRESMQEKVSPNGYDFSTFTINTHTSTEEQHRLQEISE
ncbi:hypothetical protein YC2023_100247 [Brassica napus]